MFYCMVTRNSVRFFTQACTPALHYPVPVGHAKDLGEFIRLVVPSDSQPKLHRGRYPKCNGLPPKTIGGKKAVEPYYERLGDDGHGRWRSHERNGEKNNTVKNLSSICKIP